MWAEQVVFKYLGKKLSIFPLATLSDISWVTQLLK